MACVEKMRGTPNLRRGRTSRKDYLLPLACFAWAVASVSGYLSRSIHLTSSKLNYRRLPDTSRGRHALNGADDDRISLELANATVSIPRREFLSCTSAATLATTLSYTYPDKSVAADPLSSSLADAKPAVDSSSGSVLYDPTVPFSSSRQMRAVTLANGIQVLLVSDKRAPLSSAALTIEGAGQFSDPYIQNGTVPLSGLAHLMEHMILSSDNRGRLPTIQNRPQEFEDWLADREGASNGFTAFEKVCFYFSCPFDAFPEAIERFAGLFYQEVVDRACRNKDAIAREVRRVNSELNFTNSFTRELYLTKSLMNPDHPYARFSAGNLESLETIPAKYDIDMTEQLQAFFAERYQPKNAILVVVSPSSLDSIELWAAPFATALSKRKPRVESAATLDPRSFPEPFPKQTRVSPICIFRPKGSVAPLDENYETLSFQWALGLDYTGLKTDKSRNCVTSAQIGFILSQVLERRGPGSLYTLLRRRDWVPDSTKGLPRISFPVDVSGFQLMKLELTLTLEGFASRSAVIAAVYDGINSLQSSGPMPFLLSRELISQYCTVAELYGSALAPRPPDAIELAFDGQFFGVTTPRGIAVPGWNRFPTAQDTGAIKNLQAEMMDVLKLLSDPANAIILVTASKNAIKRAQQDIFDNSLPELSPASWNIAPLTGARYYNDNMFRLSGKVNEWLVARLLEDELSPPSLNPLIPPSLRPARLVTKDDMSLQQTIMLDEISTKSSRRAFIDIPFSGKSKESAFDEEGEEDKNLSDPTKSSIVRDYWAVLQVLSHDKNSPRLQLPRVPPEPSIRSVFVLQLLSSRPARADTNMAAHAELWKVSLEYAMADLGELGLPAGCAYDISFNKFGMRICFLGLSQNIASYARRISRRIVDHQNRLLDKQQVSFPPIAVDTALRNAQRSVNISPIRKRQVLSALRQTTTTDAAVESIAFFRSCSGGVCYSQGDLLPKETAALLGDLKGIFRKVTGSNVRPVPAIPELDDLIYRPNWIPRAASVCSIPGANFVSDPCGRVRR